MNYCLFLQDPDFDVQGLVENREYLFRVAAANANGVGDWLEAESPIVAKLPFGGYKQIMTFWCTL